MADFPKRGGRTPLRLVVSTEEVLSSSQQTTDLTSLEDGTDKYGHPLQFWMLAPFSAGLVFSLASGRDALRYASNTGR